MKRGLRTHHNPRLRFIVEPGEEGGAEAEAPQEEAADAETEGDEGDDDPGEDNFDPKRALSKIRKLNSENKNLREREKAAEGKVSESDKRIADLESELLRVRVGAKLGLPEELIDRLKGNSSEEILADAEKLLALVGGSKPPTQKPSTALRGGGDPATPPEDDPKQIVASIPRGL